MDKKHSSSNEGFVGEQEIRDEPYEQVPIYRGVAAGMLLFQVGCMLAYGLNGKYFEESLIKSPKDAYCYLNEICLFLFPLLGFGLLLSSYKNGTWLGMGSAVIVVAVSIQLTPILQKFWFFIFNTSFTNEPTAEQVGDNISYFWEYYSDLYFTGSRMALRTSLLSSVSFLTFMTSVIGRLSVTELFSSLLIFQYLWNMTYSLLIYLCLFKDFNADEYHSPYYFDAYGGTFIYVFAAFFGLSYSCFIKNIRFPSNNKNNQQSQFSLTLASMGTAFIFATFFFSANKFFTYSNYGQNISVFAILFGMIGSVIGTYIGSLLFGRVGVKQCLVGTITGGVVISAAAPLVFSLGIMITIGLVTGFLSGLYMRIIDKKVNKDFIHDAMGLFGPFLLSSVGGSMLVLPCMMIFYKFKDQTLPGGFNSPPVTRDLVGWQLVYVGISAGIGLGAGIFAGLVSFCCQGSSYVGSSLRYFSRDTGLFFQPKDDLHSQKGEMTNKRLKQRNM